MTKARLLRRWTAILLVLTLALLSACGGEPTAGNTDNGAGASTSGGTGSKPKIAFIMKTMNHPFFADMKDAAQEKCDELGYDVYFDGPDREIETEKQVQLIENAIIQKVDVICCTATDSKALVDVIKKCNDAGIPFIAIDANIDEETLAEADAHIATFIGSDNYQGGLLAGKYMAELFAGATDTVEIGIIEGIPGHETAINRKAGFEDGIKDNDKLTVVASQTGSWERELGMSVAQNMLQANPGIQGIFASNDNMGLGAIEAARAANRLEEIQVIGFDGIDDALDAIELGEMTASVGQYPKRMGILAIECAQRLIEDASADLGATNYTDISVVDQSNLAAYKQ